MSNEVIRKTIETEIISLEEAIHDYKEAYNDYTTTIRRANKFYKNDCDVVEAILYQYFPGAKDITVKGGVITILYQRYDCMGINPEFIHQLHDLTEDYTIRITNSDVMIHLPIIKM